jgi:hypothetical protein
MAVDRKTAAPRALRHPARVRTQDLTGGGTTANERLTPAAPLRAIAPIVVVSTIVVLASGVALLFAGPESRDTLLPIHKVSFIVWACSPDCMSWLTSPCSLCPEFDPWLHSSGLLHHHD